MQYKDVEHLIHRILKNQLKGSTYRFFCIGNPGILPGYRHLYIDTKKRKSNKIKKTILP